MNNNEKGCIDKTKDENSEIVQKCKRKEVNEDESNCLTADVTAIKTKTDKEMEKVICPV